MAGVHLTRQILPGLGHFQGLLPVLPVEALGKGASPCFAIGTVCPRLVDQGVTIDRPPRDSRMAFVRSPDNVSVELLQKGEAKPPQEPWASMPNTGHW